MSNRLITSEGLAQGPYVAARGGVEPTTFRTEGTHNLHFTNHAPGKRNVLRSLQTEDTIFWGSNPPKVLKPRMHIEYSPLFQQNL